MMAVQPVVTETNFNRVFIVDDDDLFRESLGLNLAEEGYEVVDFANGESALEFMMSGEEAEAVLLDWRMQIGRATSELQSLMRISYAVFCLKKKKIKNML